MNKKTGAEPSGELKPDTLLTVGGRDPFAQHGYVNTPVYHASTLLYPTAEDYVAHRGRYHYGRRGTPTSEALENAVPVIITTLIPARRRSFTAAAAVGRTGSLRATKPRKVRSRTWRS